MNISQEDFDTMVARVSEKYGSMDEPNWGFVATAIKEKPYRQFIASLEDLGEISEDTDENDDVSFGYYIKTGAQLHSLRLSMVGPYAMLIQARPGALVSGAGVCLSTQCAELCERLANAGITLLDAADLTRSIPLRLEDGTACTVFRALFIDTDVEHWRLL